MQCPLWPFMLTHESLCSHRSAALAACVGLCPTHSFPFPPRHFESVIPQLHLDSHWRLKLPEAAVVQTCCMAFLAWLGSAQRGHSGAGRACFVFPGLVLLPVCVLLTVESWFFCVLRGFMVTWWRGWVRRRFLLVALLYN